MTIPASQIVGVFPSVVSGGGNPLSMNGLFMTQNLLTPTGTVLSFPTQAAVSGFYGPASAEAALGLIYFAGYTRSTLKPGAMLFAPFNLAARAAFLQSGSLAGVTLSQLQAFTGTLTVTVDGTAETSSAINLSAATSFTNAATLIQAAFTSPIFAVTWSAVQSAFVITSTLTGVTATITFATGTIAADLNMTAATGAFLSQGAAADTPASAMANVIANSQNWAAFTTMWEPAIGDKENFAIWENAQNNRYLYQEWDSDAQSSTQGSTTCFGAIATGAGYSGVAAISGDPVLAASTGVALATLALNAATFVLGAIASIPFATPNGRTSLAFLTSGAISPTCASLQTADNLLANGYNYYGSYANANTDFTLLYNGQMFGPFKSIVRYVNQIYMNSQFQSALFNLLVNFGPPSYNPAGYGLIRNTLQDPINAALAFGAIRTGVALSAQQTAEVNQQAGVNAASVIQTNGYYLQILDPGAAARANGDTPIINFWYTDGGDILRISMASINIL